MLRVAYLSQFSRGKLADLVALLSGRNFETKTYEEAIAAASFERLGKGVMEFMSETNFKRFLMIIKSAGFVDSSLLRGQGPLNFAYALFLKLRSEQYPADKIERYVCRWFVLTLLTGRYSGTVETKYDQDIRAIAEQGFEEYLQRIEEAEFSDTFWSVGLVQNLNTSNSNHPAFLTFIAAQCLENSRGFLSRNITVRSLLEHKGDLHHLFPKDYLKKQFGLRRAEYNQVANYVYTQQEINIAIGNQSPAKYMAIVRSQCETKKTIYGGITELEDLCNNLDECAIPRLFINNPVHEYEDFLIARRKLMAERLRIYYANL